VGLSGIPGETDGFRISGPFASPDRLEEQVRIERAAETRTVGTPICKLGMHGGDRVTDADAKSDLVRGINAREMEAWFQPQVGPDERLTGFEALLRWNHTVRGLIRPGDFIPLAETTGLINILGSWIATEACLSCRSWPRSANEGLSVAINASAVQFD
jgi:hypothetical protein